MSEMIERVAGVLALRTGLRPWELDERQKKEFRANARAAIEAMREPSWSMTCACTQTYAGCGLDESEAAAVWRSMIDNALQSDEAKTC